MPQTRRIVRRLVVLGTVASCLCFAAWARPGEGKSQSAPAIDPTMEQIMKAAAPGAMHEKLNPLAGKWKTVVTSYMGPGETTSTEGTAEVEWVLGGRFLRETLRGTFMGMPFEGMGLTGYDNVSKQYIASWVDNFGTGMMTSTGKADPSGKTISWTAIYNDPTTGTPTSSRSVLEFVDANRHVFTMYGMVEGKEVKQMELVYTRQ